MDRLLGEWKMDPTLTQNVDGYAEAAQMPEEVRDIVKNSPASYSLTKDGDTYHSVFEMGGQKESLSYQLDQEFTSDSFGMHCVNMYTVKDGKLHGTHVYQGKTTASTVYLEDGKLVFENTCGGQTMKVVMLRC